jgi:hypothetical protein
MPALKTVFSLRYKDESSLVSDHCAINSSCFTLEDEGITIFRNFGNDSPNLNVPYRRNLESSSFIYQFGYNTQYGVRGPVLIFFIEFTSNSWIYLPCSMFVNLYPSLFMFHNPTFNALCTPLSFEVDLYLSPSVALSSTTGLFLLDNQLPVKHRQVLAQALGLSVFVAACPPLAFPLFPVSNLRQADSWPCCLVDILRLFLFWFVELHPLSLINWYIWFWIKLHPFH